LGTTLLSYIKMPILMSFLTGLGLVLFLILPGSEQAWAQTSPSYIQEEHVVNQGGHPEEGTVFTSASFQVTLDSLGESVNPALVNSPSFTGSVGFGLSYPPPGEVFNLMLSGTALNWNVEASRGTYSLYRGLVTDLPGTYGTVFQQGINAESTTDVDMPGSGECYFYLICVDNRLDEQGTKGYNSSGIER